MPVDVNHVPPTPPPVAVVARTDRRVYRRGMPVGLQISITNIGASPVPIYVLTTERPEYESTIYLTRPGGGTTACGPQLEGDELPLTVSASFPNIGPGRSLRLPVSGYRSLLRWGCNLKAIGSYTLRLRRKFRDFSSGGYSDVESPPVVFNVVER